MKPLRPVMGALALALGACGGASAPDWPAGTVLAVDGLALSGTEVDRVAGWLADLTPTLAAPEHRRRALTMHLLPKLAADARYAAEREEARAAAEEARALLADDAPPEGTPVEGGWDVLGVATWAAVRDLPVGRWTGPVDDLGRFRLIRVLERFPGPTTASEIFVAEARDFPYVPPDLDDDGLGALTWDAQLTIVDPAYERVVPLAWRANMNGATDVPAAAGGTP